MIIKLLLESDKPLYQQLKERIIYSLALGEIKQGELLPSVRQLASSLSINMHTVNKAYSQLADEGFLTIYKGKGAIINPKSKYKANSQNYNLLRESLEIIGAEAKCRSVSKDEFIKMCNEAYSVFAKENKNDK